MVPLQNLYQVRRSGSRRRQRANAQQDALKAQAGLDAGAMLQLDLVHFRKAASFRESGKDSAP
eukprot:1134882-Pelagomonas_calceolata.AAC.2